MDEQLIRYIAGRATQDEAADVERWIAEDPSHDALLRDLTRIWAGTNALAEEAQGAAVPIDQIRRLLEARRTADGGNQVAPHALQDGPAPPTGRSAAGVGGRPAPTGQRPTSRGARLQRGFARAAAVVALLLGGSAFGVWLGSYEGAAPQFGLEEVRTVAGEMATAELIDGTVIRLAPESVLRFKRGSNDRSVWLEGRAFFSVHHDPERPFRVETAAGEAMVLGTRFDIQVRAEGLQVSVVEGVVAMNAGPGPVRVEAGHVGRLTPGRSVEVSREEDILRRVDWVGQFIAFERTPLTQVALEVERLYGLPVDIQGEELGSRTVTGVYEGRTFQQTLEVICLVVGAHCQIGESGAAIQP